jgi:excisionase family DNA binding protein
MSSDTGSSRPNAISINDSGEFLRPCEVARKLGISSAAVQRHLRAKRLPGFKFGKLWLVSKKDLQAFLVKLTSSLPPR